jgi:hypothetical protein
LFKKLVKYFNKKEIKEENTNQPPKTPPKEVEIEITILGNITKVDIKDDCNVIEYVESIKKRGQEWVEDKIPNATLFDKSTNIKRKTIYLFEKENKRYSCYENDRIIHINERIASDNNHIDERIITLYKLEDNYIVSRMKHDEQRSTYFVKSHEKKNPEYEFFQLGKDNALDVVKEVLSNLENISNVSSIIDIDLIYERFGFERKINQEVRVKTVTINEDESVKVKKK